MSKKYEVIRNFYDSEDKEKDGAPKHYQKEKTYPRPANKKVSEERIEELATNKNSFGLPFIKEITEDDKNTEEKIEEKESE